MAESLMTRIAAAVVGAWCLLAATNAAAAPNEPPRLPDVSAICLGVGSCPAIVDRLRDALGRLQDHDAKSEHSSGIVFSSGAPTVASQFGHGVYVDQIGQGNRATVRQTPLKGSSQAYGHVSQRGDANVATLNQKGSAFTEWTQSGAANTGQVDQQGGGHNTLTLLQTGSGNAAAVNQTASALANGAAITQNGEDNRVTLVQTGADNHATLSQNGSANTMSATQTGSTRLTWTQDGQHLSNLGITMGAGQAMTITQTNPY